MKKKECVAMLLAGGQGSRLGALTKNIAKPAVSFGGKYRIIDFSLSNCGNSHIDTVGVLTQYRPFRLNSYIGNGEEWDLAESDGGAFILPPYATEKGGEWYKGTADAIYQNLDFIEAYNPEYVLILSGDHLYKMDYRNMLETHKKNQADLTISVMQVPIEEASRFGIITAQEDGRIVKFTEKPKEPDSTLASMGIYIFNKSLLKEALEKDGKDKNSSHDFGKDVIPALLNAGRRIFCHEFSGYWKDVGTILSYYETSMELLDPSPEFDLFSKDFPVMSNSNIQPPHYIGPDASVTESLVSNGSRVLGRVNHSIMSTDSFVGEGAEVADSVLLPGATVHSGAKVTRAILGENAVVEANVILGGGKPDSDIVVVGDDEIIKLEG
jgi:glucose-1-phosphate adenylyltransferase